MDCSNAPAILLVLVVGRKSVPSFSDKSFPTYDIGLSTCRIWTDQVTYHSAASASPFTEPTGVNPAEKYKALGESLHSYGSYLTQCLPKYIQQFSVVKDELTLYVAPQSIVPTLTFLRDHSNCQYKSVMDIAGVDYPTRSQRFEVVYNLLSHKFNSRIRVKTYADEATPVPSACGVFRGADW